MITHTGVWEKLVCTEPDGPYVVSDIHMASPSSRFHFVALVHTVRTVVRT